MPVHVPNNTSDPTPSLDPLDRPIRGIKKIAEAIGESRYITRLIKDDLDLVEVAGPPTTTLRRLQKVFSGPEK